jgi:hypothetical protein
MSAGDGQTTSWKNVSVTVSHPEFSVELDEILVAPLNPTEGVKVSFYVVASNVGDLEGVAELVWNVDGEVVTTILIELEEGGDALSQFSWIAVSGEHTISVSSGDALKTVTVFVVSSAEVEDDEEMNLWLYSVPVIAVVVGVVIMLRRMLGGGDDEFEWE